MSDFGTDIRTIARTRELEEKIAIALRIARNAEKAAIFGQRAIAYGAAGGATDVVGGAKNSTIPPGTSQTVDAAVDAVKKALDANNWLNNSQTPPGKESKGTDKSQNAYHYLAGTVNAEEILDAAQSIAGGIVEGLHSFDKSEPNGLGGGIGLSDKINGVWATDYITDNPFLMSLDGMYRLPEGWEDPFTPPVWEGWQGGYFWRATNPAFAEGSVPGICANESIEAVKAAFPAPYPSGYGDALITTDPFQVNESTWRFGWKQGPLSPSENLSDILRIACTVQGETLCPASAPTTMDTWPTVGNYILALTGGLWTPNIYDSEVPFHMQGTQSAVPFEMPGGRHGIMEPAIGGGQILYEVSTGAPYSTDTQRLENAINTAIYFRSDGTIGHFIPADQIIHWLPKQR